MKHRLEKSKLPFVRAGNDILISLNPNGPITVNGSDPVYGNRLLQSYASKWRPDLEKAELMNTGLRWVCACVSVCVCAQGVVAYLRAREGEW